MFYKVCDVFVWFSDVYNSVMSDIRWFLWFSDVYIMVSIQFGSANHLMVVHRIVTGSIHTVMYPHVRVAKGKKSTYVCQLFTNHVNRKMNVVWRSWLSLAKLECVSSFIVSKNMLARTLYIHTAIQAVSKFYLLLSSKKFNIRSLQLHR